MPILNDLLKKRIVKQLSRRDLVKYSQAKSKKSYGIVQEYLTRDYNEYLKMNSLKDKDVICVDLGSYNRRFTKNTINVDIVQEGDTDLIWDITKKLPIKSGSADFVICSAVLEHVNDPIAVVREMKRILRKGGGVWVDIPFLQPFHESPDDFQRYTLSGVKHLFRDYDIIKCSSIPGMGFAVHWILKDLAGVMKWEKISLKKYPTVSKLLDEKHLEKLYSEFTKLDTNLVAKYPDGQPNALHITASGIFVFAVKK